MTLSVISSALLNGACGDDRLERAKAAVRADAKKTVAEERAGEGEYEGVVAGPKDSGEIRSTECVERTTRKFRCRVIFASGSEFRWRVTFDEFDEVSIERYR